MAESEIIKKALMAVQGDDLDAARDALFAALEDHPDRLDLVHTLAIIELQSGRPDHALSMAEKAAAVLSERRSPDDLKLLPSLLLAAGAACEELDRPEAAEKAYNQILEIEPGHPLASQGKGHLLLAWGRLEEGVAILQSVVDQGTDDPRFIEATTKLIAGVKAFNVDDLHPRNFVDAHQGGYCEFFNHHADRTAADGWIAEAARMHRDEQGNLVPSVGEDARPYAATRVDLVDPASGQAGLVGDEPMIVALNGHEIISQAPILFEWPNNDFPTWGSSQVPWNLLNISIVFEGDLPEEKVDSTIGDWYTAGFDGAFGSPDRGRFHSITPPMPIGENGVRYDLDCGRAEPSAIDDLLKRLDVLHSSHPIAAMMIGRGFIPVP